MQEERSQTQIEITNLHKIIADYEAKFSLMSGDLDRSNRRDFGLQLENESLRSLSANKQDREIYWQSSEKKSENLKRGGYAVRKDVCR